MFELALFAIIVIALWKIFYHVSEAITGFFGTPQERRQRRLKREREQGGN